MFLFINQEGGSTMNAEARWPLTKEIRDKLIATLTDNLPLLRAKLDISQEEISNLVGISRQTYCSIESKKRSMSWPTYLSLVFFFDCNEKNHNLLRHLGCFPDVLVDSSILNKHDKAMQENADASAEIISMLSKLDKQAIQSLQTVAMVEYARCSKIPGEAVVKAFNGVDFRNPLEPKDKDIAKAMENLKKRNSKNE